MSEPQKKTRINIPREFDETDRQIMAQKIIERIIERTDSGLDVNGKKFAGYSDSYVNSLDFKIAGKSKNDVNLQLSGDMLNSLQVLEDGPGHITVGYNEGTPENEKAAWAEASDKTVQRKFLGVNDKELELIIAETRLSRPKSLQGLANQEQVVKGSKDVQANIVKSILRNFLIDVDES